MRWTQLKRDIEDIFADSLKGRVEVWSTRYRHAVHQYGEGWVTHDKQKIVTMGTLRFDNAVFLTGCGYNKGYDLIRDKGAFTSEDFNRSLYSYLNLGIEAAIRSPNPIIRAFAMLDRRLGKRRLREFDPNGENPLVVQFHRLRCKAEGISIRSSAMPLPLATELASE